jgi:hypothetical protein
MKKLLLLITGLLLFFSAEGQILRYSNYTAPVTPPAETNDFLTSLVAYWKLDEASGTLVDSDGANDMTAYNSPTYGEDGMGLGDALLFARASSQYLQCSAAADLVIYDQDVSACAWVYFSTIPASGQYIIIGGESSAFGMGLVSDGTYMQFRIWSVGSVPGTASTATLSTGAWHFVAVSFDNSETTNNCTYYIDGTAETITFDQTFGSVADSNVLGARRSTSEFFDGKLCQIGLWKGRIMSEAEWDDIYNSGNGLAYESYE